VGGAWTLGVLAALAETEGFDASVSDVVVGTSAGSVVAALIGSRVAPELIVATLTGGDSAAVGSVATATVDVPDQVQRSLGLLPRPAPVPGNLRLAARSVAQPTRRSVWTAAAALMPRGRGDLAPVGELVERFSGDEGWPDRPRTWLVAMDFDSGERVAFGAAGEPRPSMSEAVMASCSVPGVFPPRLIGNRRYIDGGAVSVTNADLLATEHLDEVVVLAPMAMHEPAARWSSAGGLERRVRRHHTRRLMAEVGRLGATGTNVRVFAPTTEDLAAMGPNSFDTSRRQRVFRTAVRTTTSRLVRTAPEGSRPDAAAGIA
jgi:NTE family protein